MGGLLLPLVLATPFASGDDDEPTDAGRVDMSTIDLGQDAGPSDGGPIDSGPPIDAGPQDAGALEDATPADAGPSDDAAPPPHDGGPAPDAGPTPDAGPANTCEAAGGECVPVVPDACSEGIVGDAREYSCGGGLGVMCCLPDRPICRFEGTPEEGWYQPDGTRLCNASCAGATATCDAIGTRSEGWYAPTDDQGCMLGRLIVWTDCG